MIVLLVSDQYQCKCVHVNRFSPLTVDDDSFVIDIECFVDKLGDVKAQVVETRAVVESKCHHKGKKNYVKNQSINGGLVKNCIKFQENGRNKVPPWLPLVLTVIMTKVPPIKYHMIKITWK